MSKTKDETTCLGCGDVFWVGIMYRQPGAGWRCSPCADKYLVSRPFSYGRVFAGDGITDLAGNPIVKPKKKPDAEKAQTQQTLDDYKNGQR